MFKDSLFLINSIGLLLKMISIDACFKVLRTMLLAFFYLLLRYFALRVTRCFDKCLENVINNLNSCKENMILYNIRLIIFCNNKYYNKKFTYWLKSNISYFFIIFMNCHIYGIILSIIKLPLILI